MANIEYYFLIDIFYPFKPARLRHALHKISVVKWYIFYFTNYFHYFVNDLIIYMLVS